MTHLKLREKFIRFFEKRGHQTLPSASLIPNNDPSLLFVNAGMNPFKNIFLGLESPPYKKAVTIQKCLRAGGKHNDIETVGESPWHHTFFEMLGNFSFGDYFRKEAIQMAWDFLTKELNLPSCHLYVSVYEKDEESYSFWRSEQNIPENKIYQRGAEDNFWQMGETGPCGPCSDILYYKGNKTRPDPSELLEIWSLVFMEFYDAPGGQRQKLSVPCIDTGIGMERLCSILQNKQSNFHNDLFLEIILNLQKACPFKYDFKEPFQTEQQIAFRVLADHCRGAGFLIADGVLPGNEGPNYVLRRILRRAFYYSYKLSEKRGLLLKGIETLISLMKDIYPELNRESQLIYSTIESEEKRFSDSLNFGKKILSQKIKNLPEKNKHLDSHTVWDLYSTYGFPFDLTQLIAKEADCQVNLKEVEEIKTARVKEEKSLAHNKLSTGKAFKTELTKKAARYHSHLKNFQPTEFTGWENATSKGQILSLWAFPMILSTDNPSSFIQSNKGQKHLKHISDSPSGSLKKGQRGFVITDTTCFYPEGGGPLGDEGTMETSTGRAFVSDCQKISQTILHEVEVLEGDLTTGQKIRLSVNKNYRRLMATSHSGTHLLHFALRKVLGTSVRQAGSLVEPGRLRFDFTSPLALTEKQLKKAEDSVNHIIQEGRKVSSCNFPYKKAVKEGALSLAGENYESVVRVITMGDSKELCGGIHVANTKEIQIFKIVSETGVQAGVRRIVAYTGERAKRWLKLLKTQMEELQAFLAKPDVISHCPVDLNPLKNPFTEWAKFWDQKIKFLEKQLEQKSSSGAAIEPKQPGSADALSGNKQNYEIGSSPKSNLLQKNLELRKYLQIPPTKENENDNPLIKAFQKKKQRLKNLTKKWESLKDLSIDKEFLIRKAKSFKEGSYLLVVELPIENPKGLANLADQLKARLRSGLVVALGKGEKQCPLIVTVTKDLQDTFPASDILKEIVAPLLKGRGGGQARFAQGIATDKKAFQRLESLLQSKLKVFKIQE